MICIAGALGLGRWAHDLSSAESLAGWLLAHPPDIKVWKSTLQSRGLAPPKKPGVVNSAMRTLPLSIDDRGSVWAAEEGLWIAVFASDSSATPAVIYCFKCDKAPRQWAPIGTGWPAIEETLSWLDPRLEALKKQVPARKSATAWSDPREIHY